MSALLLTPDELAQLTDRTQPAAQIRALRSMGFREGVDFRVSPAGKPKVPRAAVESREEPAMIEGPRFDQLTLVRPAYGQKA